MWCGLGTLGGIYEPVLATCKCRTVDRQTMLWELIDWLTHLSLSLVCDTRCFLLSYSDGNCVSAAAKWYFCWPGFQDVPSRSTNSCNTQHSLFILATSPHIVFPSWVGILSNLNHITYENSDYVGAIFCSTISFICPVVCVASPCLFTRHPANILVLASLQHLDFWIQWVF